MDFMDFINQLEQEFSDKKGFFKKIDSEKCLSIIAQMKLAYPEAMKEAAYIIANKQKIIDNAEVVARKAVKEAEAKAEQMVSETEILHVAESQAQDMVRNAQEQSNYVVNNAYEHLNNVFLDMESYMEDKLKMIQANRMELDNAFGFKDKTE